MLLYRPDESDRVIRLSNSNQPFNRRRRHEEIGVRQEKKVCLALILVKCPVVSGAVSEIFVVFANFDTTVLRVLE